MPWKAPDRPRGDISQAYNSGIVEISSISDGQTAPGYQPRPVRTVKATLPYDERSLGIQRYYSAQQNQIQIERVIRVPAGAAAIVTQDVAETEDGRTYRIDLVQAVRDVYPASLDLTLVRIDTGAVPVSDSDTGGGSA